MTECLYKMTTLEQAIREKLAKLDADFAKREAAYKRNRDALIYALNCETSGYWDLPADNTGAVAVTAPLPPHPFQQGPPPPIELLGISEGEQRSQLMIVLAAVGHVKEPFDKDDVRKKLMESHWKNVVTENTLKNISSFLWRLHKDGLITIKEKGQGHRPSTYEKVKPQT